MSGYSYSEKNIINVTKFADIFLLKCSGQNIKERIKTLEWLLDEKGVNYPELHHFVYEGQHQLLKWYCKTTKYVDIYAPLHTFASLLNEVIYNCSPLVKEISGEVISSDISAVEALCVLASVKGEYNVLHYLVKEKIKKGFLVNGMNMLHIAAACGHLHIVKWFVTQRWYSLKKVTTNGMTACHLALKYNHAVVGVYLLGISEMKDIKDSDGKSNLWWTLQSTNVLLKKVAMEHSNLNSCEDLKLLIDNKVEFKEFEIVLNASGIRQYFFERGTFYEIRPGHVWALQYGYYDKESFYESYKDDFSLFFSSIVMNAMVLYDDEFLHWLLELLHESKEKREIYNENEFIKCLSTYSLKIGKEKFYDIIDNIVNESLNNKIKEKKIHECSKELIKLFTVGASIEVIGKENKV